MNVLRNTVFDEAENKEIADERADTAEQCHFPYRIGGR